MHAFAVETNVSGGPHAAAQAREVVHAELDGKVPGGLVDDIALLVTELVANGVRHGGAGDRRATLRLRLQGRPPGLHVEVVNPDGALAAVAPRRPDYGGGGGIGLQLVDRLAARWGVRKGPPTTVWFEIDC